mmetsp:Transcript_56207/g.159539  ORF Transcript_56207/g.159539 Transcript_56207/m.159539 type:complete len:936 (+) Transcript_56207:19-2826(+)
MAPPDEEALAMVEQLVIIPLRSQVVFPSVRQAVELPKATFDEVLEHLERTGASNIGVLAMRPSRKGPLESKGDFFEIGTYCRLVSHAVAGAQQGPGAKGGEAAGKGGKASVRMTLEGRSRFRLLSWQQETPLRVARVQVLEEEPEADEGDVATRALVHSIQEKMTELAKGGQQGEGVKAALGGGKQRQFRWPSSPSMLTSVVGATLVQLSMEERQHILETLELRQRLELVLDLLQRETEAKRMSSEISSGIQKSREQELRQVVLQRQIQEVQKDLQRVRAKTQQKEAGSADEGAQAEEEGEEDEAARLGEKLAQAGLSEDATKIAKRELRRLKSIQPHHPEYTTTHTYLELLSSLPWKQGSEDCFDLTQARRVLNEDHRGLDKVKKRILEFLAVQKMRGDMKGPILCLHGPPGIGKTTTCRLVAKLHGGYEVLEYNASDARGMKIIQAMAEGIADNTTISFAGPGKRKAPGLTSRAVIVMDEVDGMGAGDRGGNAALIKMIKKTRNPIICICNDSHSPKVRSLAFSCYDLKFTRPTKATVAQRCAQIARSEGLQVEENALEELAESCGSDMRMVLNQLQMLAKSPLYKSVGVNYMDMKQKLREISKDQGIMMTTFQACQKLLSTSEGARLSFRDRLDLFFVDHSIMGLLIQENYLNAVGRKPVDVDLLTRCAYSADLMTLGDMMNARVRGNQEWSLLPDIGLASCVYPAHITNGFLSFPSFPSFLGKYSTQSRMRRLCTELETHVRLFSTVSRGNLPTSGFADLLYRRAMRPLVDGGPEAVATTAGVLDAYGLRKEHLVEHLTELRQHLGEEDLFKLIDPKVKAAVTREFNAGSHAVRVVIPTKGKRKGAGAPNEDPLGEEDEREEEAPADGEAAEEEEGASSLVKVKGKPKGKAKAKAAGPASSRAGDSPASANMSPVAAKAKAKARGKAKGRP